MNTVLALHNINRWAFLLLGLYAITKCILGLVKNQGYTKMHNRSAVLLLSFSYLQLILGLILYFGRGWHKYWPRMTEVMPDTNLRFWTIEHIFGMIVSVILIQIGRNKSKNAVVTREKHRKALAYFSFALLIVLATVPWSFRGEIARSLWP